MTHPEPGGLTGDLAPCLPPSDPDPPANADRCPADTQAQKVDIEHAYRTFWHDLYLRARRRGHDHEDARDLTQDFFLAAHEHQYLARFNPCISRLSGYVHMLFHRFLCHVERRLRAARHGGGMHLLSLDSSPNPDRVHPALAYVDRPDWICDRDWARELVTRTVLAASPSQTARARCTSAARADPEESIDATNPGTEPPPSARTSTPALRMALCRARRRARADLHRALQRESLAPSDVMEAFRYLRTMGQI